MNAPPPPPPHGGVPKGSGLPPGKYDIFVIPEHSAGSGFLYLPSLQPNVNSFAAGFASALILVALFQSMAPAFRAWWDQFQGMGNTGLLLIIAGVGFGAWALGRTQQDGSKPSPSGGHAGHGDGAGFGSHTNGAAPGPDPNAAPPPPPPHSEQKPSTPQQEKPKPSWQQRQAPPQPGTAKAESAKGSWEKAREETRKREEERKAKEADQKRREEAAKRLAELRAKEARERQERETKREKEAKEAQAKKDAEQKAADAKAAELKAAEAKKKAAEEAARTSRNGSSYAYSGVGEKTSMWPNGRPPVPPHSPTKSSSSSPNKRPPPPTAKTYLSTDEDQYSFRPYDKPKKPRHKPSVSSLSESEASWAPSQTTAKTSPPASYRGPYSTKDPDKIVISGVYLFASQFAKEPASQLLSGVGPVTDGLILRITTEGLFIDDDVRGVPQREWDVKAWTLKQVEVWCPPHCLTPSSQTPSLAQAKPSPNLLHKMAGSKGAARSQAGNPRILTGDEADVYLAEMLHACKDCCRVGLCDEHQLSRNANIVLPTGQTGEWKDTGLHVLRATVKDQDGKRYLFVVEDEESWKLAVGLQRLRKGTGARQLGVSGMSPSDAKGTLEMLGYH